MIELAEDNVECETVTQEASEVIILEESTTVERSEHHEVIVTVTCEDDDEPESIDSLVFDVPLADVTVKAGGEARMFVKVTGDPVPWVKWFRDGTEIKGCGGCDIFYELVQVCR